MTASMSPATRKAQSPSGTQVKAARLAVGLCQTAAAELVHVSCRAWQQWEADDRKMHPAFWELFKLKSNGKPD